MRGGAPGLRVNGCPAHGGVILPLALRLLASTPNSQHGSAKQPAADTQPPPPPPCPQVVIFNRGRIEQQGTPNDIIKSPCTPFIMKFVGDTNIVPATAQVGAAAVLRGLAQRSAPKVDARGEKGCSWHAGLFAFQ